MSGYCLRISTIQMVSGYEDDFPSENRDKAAESFVGAYRAESTYQWTAGTGITTKIPQLFDGPTSSQVPCLSRERMSLLVPLTH